MRFLDELYTFTMKPAGFAPCSGLIAPAAPGLEGEEPCELAGREAHKLVIHPWVQVNENQTSVKEYIITSHHMEKTEAGFEGLYIREIALEYNYTQNSYIIIRFPMPRRSAL